MNIITKLNIRQKIMLALTFLAALFLGWQIYNFAHTQTPTATHPVANGTNTNPPSTPASLPATAALPPPQVVNHLPPSVATNPYAEMEQHEYLDLVRQYQIAKMKRQILEEEAGVANAQKNISDAGKGQNLQGPGAQPFSGYELGVKQEGYQLSYLDRQAGQWVATLNQNGQYFEVHIGAVLENGWRVSSISRSGVVLRKGEQKQILGFQGSENVDAQQGYSVSSGNAPTSVHVKKIAQELGITPGVPAAKGVALPNIQPTPPPALNGNLVIKPQSAKTAAEVIQDMPAAPLTAVPTAQRVQSINKPVPTQLVGSQPVNAKVIQPINSQLTSTITAVQKTDPSKNIMAKPNTDQKQPADAAKKALTSTPTLTNVSGPVDQAPVSDAIIPAPTNSNPLPAPEVSAAAEVNASKSAPSSVNQNSKAVSVKDLRQLNGTN